ncbi:MAG: hypothetical protein HOI70_08875, partial [Opitutae bacterium]|nr:hypothetical protein [Opitutae bacterium]
SQKQDSIDLDAQRFCVHGHLIADVYQEVFPDAKLITWLRNPVDRTVSLYHHILNNPDPENHLHKEMLLGNLNLLDFSELEWARNQSLFWIGNRNPEDFKFIGFLENKQASIVKCAAALNWTYVPKFPWENKSINGKHPKASSKEREFILSKNQEELAWIKHAMTLHG